MLPEYVLGLVIVAGVSHRPLLREYHHVRALFARLPDELGGSIDVSWDRVGPFRQHRHRVHLEDCDLDHRTVNTRIWGGDLGHAGRNVYNTRGFVAERLVLERLSR